MIGPWEREHRPPDPGPPKPGPLDRRPSNPGPLEHRPLDHRPLLRTIVGDVLRRIRLDQGRTLADVAGEARVSMPYLSELERGRKEASSEILAAICAALDIDLSDLLAEARRELVQGPPAPVIRLGSTDYHGAGYHGTGYDRQSATPAGPGTDAVCLLTAAA